MKILHYSLGFPPYRTGGLTKFCIDLMEIQAKQGHEVALLWPGRMEFSRKNKIKFCDSIYKIGNTKISSYEIINPLPVPLDEGIIDVKEYTKSGDLSAYSHLLKQINPDIIHIHTLMGIHKEFIEVAENLKIRTVFTTHDYFGLCPKVTFFYDGKVCDDLECRRCSKCNQTALSIKKIKLVQSGIYKKLKDTKLLKIIRKKHRNQFFEKNKSIKQNQDTHAIKEDSMKYQQLRAYYISMLERIDMIHFNSTIAEMVYKRYLIPKDSCIISISHKGICDYRKIKEFSEESLRLTYLAPAKQFKGFDILIQALDVLHQNGNDNFKLYNYSLSGKSKPYLYEKDGFAQNELSEIFDNTDVLIAPSIWYETFGFTVLEALSFGVPVIISANMGVKDILPQDCGIVIDNIDEIKLAEVINNLNAEEMRKMNENILTNMHIVTVADMWRMIEQKCYQL